MNKIADLLFNFKVKKEEMISKSIIWGILAFGICYAIANVL
jgi:hypothetical protein